MLIYGATGSVHLADIRAALEDPAVYGNTFIWFGLGFLLVGFGLVSEQVAQVRHELDDIRKKVR